MTDARLMGKASIDWDHLDADNHENLEKLTSPYWAIDEARGKGQGEIGRGATAQAASGLTPGRAIAVAVGGAARLRLGGRGLLRGVPATRAASVAWPPNPSLPRRPLRPACRQG
jgi:hypothetical protein